MIWIPIEKRKPATGQKCLVSTTNPSVTKDRWLAEGRFQNVPMDKVTAWMPIPKPYRKIEVEQ